MIGIDFSLLLFFALAVGRIFGLAKLILLLIPGIQNAVLMEGFVLVPGTTVP